MFNLSTRRALVISGLFVGAATLFAPTKAMASGTTSGTVNLAGSVTSTLNMATSTVAGAGTLALDGSAAGAQQIAKVADLDIGTNNEQGFTLTVSSGNFTKAGGSSIAYQVATTADGVAAASGDFTVASGTAYTYNNTGATASDKRDLSIMYTPAALQDPGNYAGSITLSVADN